MTLKNPTVLPGKRLHPPHLSPKAANLCPTSYQEVEILPLFLHAEKKFWVSKNTTQALLQEIVHKKNPMGPWEKAKSWQNRFQVSRAEESPALAGWMLLRNLAQCQKIRLQHKAPYPHLQNLTDPLQTLKTLNHFLFYNSQGTEEDRKTAQRDLLAILLLKHLNQKNLQEETLRCFANQAYLHENLPNWFKICYGFPNKTGGWEKSPQAYIEKRLAQLLPYENEKTKKWLQDLKML
jgi:hypothetical protein